MTQSEHKQNQSQQNMCWTPIYANKYK